MVIYGIAVDKIIIGRGFAKREEGVTDEEFNKGKETATVKMVAYEVNDAYLFYRNHAGPTYKSGGLTDEQIAGKGFVFILRYISKELCLEIIKSTFSPQFGYTTFIDESNNVKRLPNSTGKAPFDDIIYPVVDTWNL